jgi:hypothetical protein
MPEPINCESGWEITNLQHFGARRDLSRTKNASFDSMWLQPQVLEAMSPTRGEPSVNLVPG